MATIVIVMPTYNEASCIGEMIDTLMAVTFPRGRLFARRDRADSQR
jgi:glycosyltransferase involved in cell wall biosynthesis